MAYLGKYIRQILSRQENVILPGFGSLILKEGRKSEEGSDALVPPGATVKFDPSHPKGDGRLAIEYAEGENLEVEEARQQVLELVDAIKFKLDKGERYQMEMVGEFSRDDDNRIHFRKDPNWVIDPELFGLAELDLLELEIEEEAVEPEKPDIEMPAKETAVKPSTVRTPPPVTSKPPERKTITKVERKPVNKWRIIWIVIGALIGVLALILLIPSNNSVDFGSDGITFGEDDSAAESTFTTAIGEEENSETETERIQEDPNIQATPIENPQQRNNYYIIAGSFKNIVNADELMKDMKSRGFPSEVIITENRLYRVSIISYTTKQTALDDLDRVRRESGVEGAWILTN